MINFPAGKQQTDDIRKRATEIIWKYATGMLAISIPLVGISRNILIPMVVIAGAALATAAVWASKSKEEKNEPALDLSALEDRIRKIDERLSNVETISHFDRLLAEKTAAAEAERRNAN